MKLIKYITDTDFGLEASNLDFNGWNVRQAMRGILFNDKNEIALMKIDKYKMYKLPGGGVDEGESLEDAFSREMLEETGCEADIKGCVGIVIEKRDQWTMFQISHCHIAKVNKVYKDLNLTESEKSAGFSLVWVKSIDEAISLMQNCEPQEYDNKFIKERDLSILLEAKG